MSYTPAPAPVRPEALPAYVMSELAKVRGELELLQKGNLIEEYSEPDELWTGRVVFADGTSWNPGSGRGVYVYDESTGWRYLG